MIKVENRIKQREADMKEDDEEEGETYQAIKTDPVLMPDKRTRE